MTPFDSFSLNIRGRLTVVDHPLVMGIVNATPDSFYTPSRVDGEYAAAVAAERLIAEGADIIDVGACSTRPGAEVVDKVLEMERLQKAIAGIRKASADVIVSVDTFRSQVARQAVELWGADIINDISGGQLDGEMFSTVATLGVPYVMMHTRGTPQTMVSLTEYPGGGVTVGVVRELSGRLAQARQAGIADVIVDPGFGFAKTVEQNYQLLSGLSHLRQVLGAPVLVGMSRKSMVTKLLDIAPDQSLSAVTALNLAALERGASILRVHDALQARQVVTLYQMLTQNQSCFSSL